MKKYFTTGLAILLPIVLTFLIIGFFINFVTSPFVDSVKTLLGHFDVFNEPILIFQSSKILTFFSKLFSLLAIILVILFAGLLGKLFLVDYLFHIGNRFFHRIPYFNKIYKNSQEIVRGLFSSTSTSFSKVVLVPFPTKEAKSVGLVTQESIRVNHTENPQEKIPVFVPATPNPTVGFMMMFAREELVLVNMKVDEALKFILSCGLVVPEFSIQFSDASDVKEKANK